MKMRDAARQMIQDGDEFRPGIARVREEVAIILDNEAEYLRRMDQVVGLYEREARGRVAEPSSDRMDRHGLDPGDPRGDRPVHPPTGGWTDPAPDLRVEAGA